MRPSTPPISRRWSASSTTSTTRSPPLQNFILPAGGEAAARCHLARTIVRRAERETIALSRHEQVRSEAIGYLNRLSDLLFVLARALGRADGQQEVLWRHDRRHG